MTPEAFIFMNRPAVLKKILLVDDDDDFREMIEALLRESGFLVFSAADGKHALEIFSKQPEGEIDLILTDYNMPEMDGITLCRKIRGLNSKVHFVLWSGFHESILKKECRASGNTFVCNKNDILKDFTSFIKNLLR